MTFAIYICSLFLNSNRALVSWCANNSNGCRGRSKGLSQEPAFQRKQSTYFRIENGGTVSESLIHSSRAGLIRMRRAGWVKNVRRISSSWQSSQFCLPIRSSPYTVNFIFLLYLVSAQPGSSIQQTPTYAGEHRSPLFS